MEGSSRAAKKACVRRVPRARARARPVHVLLFIVFEGWQLGVGERREIDFTCSAQSTLARYTPRILRHPE
eukprot:COSAG02_NODE_24630_length_682_cov_0.753002_1_plen_69_part_10